MIPLTENKNKYYEDQEKCHTCQKEFYYDKNEKFKFKLYKEVRDQFREEFNREFEYLGENMEKYVNISVLIKK